MFSSSITKLRELRRDEMESRQRRKSSSSSSSKGPRLERRYAVKNIDYEAAAVGESAPGRSRSLELSPDYASRTSFRIEGVEGVDRLCRTLGLSGPEDFAIPAAAWEARKARSSSDLLPRSRLLAAAPDTPPAPTAAPPEDASPGKLTESEEDSKPPSRIGAGEDPKSPTNTGREGDGGVRIKGVRPPPVLPLRPPAANSVRTPPPAMPLRPLDDESSAWDILRSFAPEFEGAAERGARRSIDSKDGEECEEREVEEEELRAGETAVNLTDSTSFSNDDDASSSTTESMFVSPNGRFKRMIKSWQRGSLLGSGSFGTVYEAISDDGFFFAIKEVSLLDQGSNAKQCILQLEQEIALLSQFEHENIVQYFGSEKEEAKLYIFLELVTQGSLASLYQKYHLRDSQVRGYTRQILNGLSYLHDRNVVHRDIKCANILVDATGSVKLADFGLAKEVTILNMLKSCKGSVYWMAPEVVNPKRTYGPAADIWSLGCTVLEMLTRQIPYPNLEWTQAMFRIGRGEPPSIPNSLSRDARDFIRLCVQVNADDRPSAAELLEHPFVKRPLSVSSGSDGSSHHNDRS